MIRFACRTCNERLAVPVRYAGRKGRCPACDAVNEVPTVSEWAEPIIPPAASHPAPMTQPHPPQKSRGTASSQSPTLPTAGPPTAGPPTAGSPTAGPTVPWSAPEAKRPAPIPEVAPIFDDEPAQMVEMSAWEDAAGMSTVAKVLIALAILLGIAGLIWGASFLFIWSKSRGV